ncbi:TPA: TetR/AcrR family transcriptional regulator [Staphylococcus aureus]
MMESKSIDPRIVRTKQLLVDAFLKISREKKLSQITVKDITDIATLNRATFYAHFTDIATLNRATFYAHFTDKEDLLDYTLSVTILKDLNDNLSISNVINEKVLRNIFISIASYIKDAAKSCELNSEAFCNKAHQRINNELEDIFAIMLENSYPEHQRDIIVNSASFLAAGISGLALHWFNTSQETADVFIDRNLPFLIHHIAHF